MRQQQLLLLHPHPLSQPPQPLHPQLLAPQVLPPQLLLPQMLLPHPPQVKRRIKMIIHQQQLLFPPKNMIFTSRE
ncbi:MAG TPA: hypothetical protein PKI76_01180 [Oscillospiraceae bacterium]|nr:hypothetical protein [Oscillospiraceae bacterium]